MELKVDCKDSPTRSTSEALQKQMESFRESMQKQADIAQKLAELRHDALMKTMEGFRAEMRSEVAVLRAYVEVEVSRHVGPVSERVAILESRAAQ